MRARFEWLFKHRDESSVNETALIFPEREKVPAPQRLLNYVGIRFTFCLGRPITIEAIA